MFEAIRQIIDRQNVRAKRIISLMRRDSAGDYTSLFTLTELESDPEGFLEATEDLVAAADRLPWPERLSVTLELLKEPLAVGEPERALVELLQRQPEAQARGIPASGLWAVVEWVEREFPEFVVRDPLRRPI